MKLFSFSKEDVYSGVTLFALSIFTVADLFINKGRSANMDGIVHTVTPNLFFLAIRNGEFPVSWIDGFANYGLPLGIIAHHLTTYLTAFFQFFVTDPVVAFNVLAFIGYFLTSLLFYIFLRIYFLPIPAIAATIFFHLAPYRILNIFIRGAMPEFFAGVFIPLVLIGLFLLIERRLLIGGIIAGLSAFAIAVTHPFMLIISQFLFVPYVVFLAYNNHMISFHSLKKSAIFVGTAVLVSFLIGIGLAGYYLLPLLLEIKYFYYGQSANHLTPNNFLELRHFIDSQWYYFTDTNILPRGFVIQVGLLETLVVISGLILAIYFIRMHMQQTLERLLVFCAITAMMMIFFMTELSSLLYQIVPVLSGIQFPWRILAVFVFIPPIILAYLFNRVEKRMLLVLFILLICTLRFPQLYGKNYVQYPASHYAFTPLNLHATVMNPIWSGRSEDYPIQQKKAAFIEGSGTVHVVAAGNAYRNYTVIANTPSRLVDYTFYFPGWELAVDGAKSVIEYQDPKYRGVMTFTVPAGTHTVSLRFEDTKVRTFSKLISIGFLAMLVIVMLFRGRLQKLLNGTT